MITKELENTLGAAVEEAIKRRHEYVTLEHLLLALLNDRTASDVIYNCGGNINSLRQELEQFFLAATRFEHKGAEVFGWASAAEGERMVDRCTAGSNHGMGRK